MIRATLVCACSVAALVTAGCAENENQPATEGGETAAANEQESVNTAELDPSELPPMVVRSASYRCTDGGALYVDVLSDEQAVTVRDSRSDTPIRLTREGSDGAFTGENRTLSGTGSEVRYSSLERPNQTCREAQG